MSVPPLQDIGNIITIEVHHPPVMPPLPQLVEAPTFHPTPAEFEDPLAYLESVREEAERFGICCIVPPPSWKPPFMIDLNKLKFPTRVQKINELMFRKVQRMKFMKDLVAFSDAAGHPLSKLPLVGGKELNLHLLFTHVSRRGGFEATTAKRKWTEVADDMNIHDVSASHLAGSLKKHYQHLLLPYERHRRDCHDRCADATDGPADQGAGSGGAGVSAGASSEVGAAPVNFQQSGGSLMSRRVSSGASQAEVVTIKAKGEERSNGEAFDAVIAYEPPKPGEELCEVCGSGEGNESILLCDRCNCGFHMQCLVPPLTQVCAVETLHPCFKLILLPSPTLYPSPTSSSSNLHPTTHLPLGARGGVVLRALFGRAVRIRIRPDVSVPPV